MKKLNYKMFVIKSNELCVWTVLERSVYDLCIKHSRMHRLPEIRSVCSESIAWGVKVQNAFSMKNFLNIRFTKCQELGAYIVHLSSHEFFRNIWSTNNNNAKSFWNMLRLPINTATASIVKRVNNIYERISIRYVQNTLCFLKWFIGDADLGHNLDHDHRSQCRYMRITNLEYIVLDVFEMISSTWTNRRCDDDR